ncbi:hypothetical protein [Nocardia nepalensis]|uniref:hypothetical protein n=1 Tax=Nocardia nepalensis TaxID=3375448 RepID=UPI003B6777AF
MSNLDMDAPNDVIAAVGHYAGTAGAFVASVGGTVGELVLPRSPESPLDQGHAQKLDWLKTTVLHALAASGRKAESTLVDAKEIVDAISGGDIAGALQIDRSAESI